MIHLATEQFELRFRIGDDKQWHGDTGRAFLGRIFVNVSDEWLRWIFAHESPVSRPAQPPIFRFRGGRGFFAIIAIGKDSVQLVESILRRRVAEALDRPIRTEALTTQVAIGRSERMRFYRAHEMVFARKARAMKTIFRADEAERHRYLQKTIIRDIGVQAEKLLLDVPAGSMPFQLIDVGPRSAVPLNKPGMNLHCGSVKYVDFMTTLDLKGHWAVGGLQNRGYGSIRPLRALSVDKSQTITVSGERHARFV
jgi:hypothetical protein